MVVRCPYTYLLTAYRRDYVHNYYGMVGSDYNYLWHAPYLIVIMLLNLYSVARFDRACISRFVIYVLAIFYCISFYIRHST